VDDQTLNVNVQKFNVGQQKFHENVQEDIELSHESQLDDQIFEESEQEEHSENIQDVIELSDESDNESLIELVFDGSDLEVIEENLPISSPQAADKVCANHVTVSSTSQHAEEVILQPIIEYREYGVVEVPKRNCKELKEEDYFDLCTTAAARIDAINSSVQPITFRSYVELLCLEDKKIAAKAALVRLGDLKLEASCRKMRLKLKRLLKASEKKLRQEVRQEVREEKLKFRKEVKKWRSEAATHKHRLLQSAKLLGNMRQKLRNVSAKLCRSNLKLHRLKALWRVTSLERNAQRSIKNQISEASHKFCS
jgi:hypothetical protein